MVEWQAKSKRKVSGGRRSSHRRCNKKLAWRGGAFSETKIGSGEKEERKVHKARGNKIKIKQKTAINANVFDKEKGKTVKAKILTVIESPSNKQYSRREIFTKGSIVEIEIDGIKKKAKITSRPGQHGIVNAVTLEEKPEEKKEEKNVKERKKPLIKPKKENKTEKNTNKPGKAEKEL